MLCALLPALAGCESADPDLAPVVERPVDLTQPETTAEGGAPESDPSPAPPSRPAVEEPGLGEQTAPAVGAYGVSAGHPDAVEVGMGVLAAGGNAADAAIATAYAVSVVEPFASGMGGGGAALVFAPGAEPVAYDYREVLRQSGQMPASDTGIPGFVAGMAALQDEQGSVDLADLIEPAVILAERGADASEMLAERLAAAAGRLPVAEAPHLFPDGRPLAQGEPLVQTELAQTLRAVADGGPAAFYSGDLAERLSQRVDGIDSESLAAYEVVRAEPPSGQLGAYTVHSAAPPLPGATVIQLLQIAEALGVDRYDPESADFIHAVAMASRVARQFLYSDIADPAFHDVPVEALTARELNAELAEQVPMDRVLGASGVPAHAGIGDPSNTTHITVVDADGMVVSMTNTVSNFWGSGQYALGFFANDQLRYFRTAERSGNEPAAGKRPVSYACPTVLTDVEGRPVLALGSPGGLRIPSIVAQVVLRWALHDQPLADAVAAPRFHHESGVLQVERPLPDDVAAQLRARGHQLQVPAFRYHFGSVQALEIDYGAGAVIGAADERREAAWRAEDAPSN